MRVGFFGLLTILFIGLKLSGHIAWTWLWVLSPLWFVPVSIFVVALAMFVTLLIVDQLD